MFKKYLLPLFVSLILISATLWLGRFQILKVYYKAKWLAASPAPVFKAHEQAFMEDRKILSQYEIFKPSQGNKDAGPYLNSMVHWEIGEIYHKGSLVLPEFVHKELNKDWVNKKPLFKKMGLKFDWMKELHQYDYWNPEENSPAYATNKKYLTYSYPIPSYRDLITWAKLRLLYGRETKDMTSAFKDVRHLSRLIWTNDYLVSSMVTINLLRLEKEIHQGNWEIIPEEVLMRAKRHFFSLPNATDMRLSDEMFQKLVNTDLGICPMFVEGLMNYISLRELLQPELNDEYERMDKLVRATSGKCRKTIVHKMWEDPTWPTVLSDDQNAFTPETESQFLLKSLTWGELKKQEKLKSLAGYLLSNIGTPNYLSGYAK